MPVLGVSVYPDMRPFDEIEEYLARAAKHGYTRVFASMFSAPGTNEEVLDLFHRLNDCAHKNGMRTSLDINPECLERLGGSPADLSVFDSIDCDILRMDGAYGEEDNFLMLNNPYGMQIEYNASALQPEAIEALVARGVDRERILACHNFYPQPYTGFRWDRFVEVNKRLSTLDIPVGAFVASHAPESHGVWDPPCGLPTVERMRNMPCGVAARLEVATGATDIFFGNAYATDEELAEVAAALAPVEPHFLSEEHRATVEEIFRYMDTSGTKAVRVCMEPLFDLTDVERKILFEFYPHYDHGDSSEWIWRSRLPRVTFADSAIPPRRYPLPQFQRGDVVMVNDNYKHYAGEVQVVLEPIDNDGTRNLVGRIDAEELLLFDVIGDGDVVEFAPVRAGGQA